MIGTVALVACAGESATPADDDVRRPKACRDLNVVAVTQGDAAAHPCSAWLKSVRGQVGKFSLVGSFTVVSRKTSSGVGVVVSAAHTQGTGAFGTANQPVVAAIAPPPRDGTLKLLVPKPDGTFGLDEQSPLYAVFHDDIPAAENNDRLTAIRPRHDFFVGVVDGQRFAGDGSQGVAPIPDPLQEGLVPLFDPSGRTLGDARFGDAVPNEQVLAMGYPQGGPAEGSFSVGAVVPDAEVPALLRELAQKGDEEGSIPFDREVEFIMRASAKPGMSGGGVFDAKSRYLGTMVRASTASPRIIRVVRSAHILRRMTSALNASPERRAIAPYVDESVAQGK
jgi:hypothetical protein